MTSSVYALCLFWRQRAKDLAAEWVCVFKKKTKKKMTALKTCWRQSASSAKADGSDKYAGCRLLLRDVLF